MMMEILFEEDTEMTSLIYDFTEKFGYAREPVLRRMPDGALVCLFLSGGAMEPARENVVLLSRSEDDGGAWSEPEVLFSHHSRAVWATELFVEGPVPMVFVHTYNPDCYYRELQTFVSYTHDSGATWTEPVSLRGFVRGASIRQGITMSNGEWCFPLYWQDTRSLFDWETDFCIQAPPPESYLFLCGVAISSNQGKTYAEYGCIAKDYHLWEPNVVEAEPGHLIMLMRSAGPACLVRSDSFDYGRTWTEPSETELPNPGTKVTLCRIGQTLVLVNNFTNVTCQVAARTMLQLWVSRDWGKSWQYRLSVDRDEESWYYPHVYLDREREMLYLAYENGRQHKLRKIPFSEIV